MPLRRNEAAAVEITALAAGAGPPANKIATRLIAREVGAEYNAVSDKDDMARLPSDFNRLSVDRFNSIENSRHDMHRTGQPSLGEKLSSTDAITETLTSIEDCDNVSRKPAIIFRNRLLSQAPCPRTSFIARST